MSKRTPEQTMILRFAQILAFSDHVGDAGNGLDNLAEEFHVDLTPFEDDDGQYDYDKLTTALNPLEPDTFEEFLFRELPKNRVKYLSPLAFRVYRDGFDWPGELDDLLQGWVDKGYLLKLYEGFLLDGTHVERDAPFPKSELFWRGTDKLKDKLVREV